MGHGRVDAKPVCCPINRALLEFGIVQEIATEHGSGIGRETTRVWQALASVVASECQRGNSEHAKN
jgi:hypothetical protein